MLTVLRHCRTHRELLWNLVRRDLRSRYRNSVLGWGWAMVNPAVMTALYAFIFTKVFIAAPDPGSPSGLDSFAFFIVVALLPWNFMSGSIGTGISAVMGAGSLITRVRLPRELLPIAGVLSLVVSLTIEFLVVLFALALVGHSALHLLPWLVLLIVLLTMFVAGVTLFLSALNVRYRDVQHLVGVALLIWFYLTPVIYSVERIPTVTTILGVSVRLRSVMLLNPMARFVVGFRATLYDQAPPDWKTTLGCAFSALSMFAIGSAYYLKRSRRFAEEL